MNTVLEQLNVVMMELVKLKEMLNDTSEQMEINEICRTKIRNVIVTEGKISDFLKYNFDCNQEFNTLENAAWYTGCLYADEFNEKTNKNDGN